ncbi:UDP-2,3-diacetamido-2,3-dideoxy-D-glucuronate 2-epimerase [Sporomusa silvacetica DSM 10669]|uniref:UDP-2,3-diacetamido-2,3-dideoxy-D-glucuronate 2-epimerase n=1 Tax=Sporomusa silvacetica DSM 10669 TaxID=1123289 RepID=A0ABZ3IQL7_9FIRM|nr:UDP-N-acetylglucosamine 2-epimerase (non-hydrolyzing) [Sporomusa silvacetica]OZC20485.1 UDP-2,3-diacetamido-2,3-dideoxy-D-glucuronate 2-epimerase [Sporomusa silvacetica DSM 10669]
MKIITILGARPQFIKAAIVSKKLRQNHQEIIVHTGQHYDYQMSALFFEEMQLPSPKYNLSVGSGTHGQQTGKMLEEIEQVLINECPQAVIVYGDTNSTMAGALAASKLNIPIFHIEAGLRSYNMRMPEEQNRRITDHVSKLLFCPTVTAVANLQLEGISEGVYNVGDVMYDAVLHFLKLAKNKYITGLPIQQIISKSSAYYLATIHRAENTDNIEKLREILKAFSELDKIVIMPVHPRIRGFIENLRNESDMNKNIIFIQPVGYLEMLLLIENCSKVMTDSGGLQKEAYFLKTPCITLRNETEWTETLAGGYNVLCPIEKETIVNTVLNVKVDEQAHNIAYFGNGQAVDKICNIINGFES